MEEKKLHTQNAYFDLLTSDHADLITKILNSPKMNFSFLLEDGLNDLPLVSEKQVSKVIEKWAEETDSIALGVYLSSSNLFIGYVIFQFGWDANDVYLNVVLSPEYHHRGIGTEIIQYMINYIFNNYIANSISAYIDETNVVAIEFVKKMGFTPTGMERRSGYRNGSYYGLRSFNILRREWKSMPQ